MKTNFIMLAIVTCLCSCQKSSTELSEGQRNKIVAEINQFTNTTFAAANEKNAEKFYLSFSDSTTGVFNGTWIDSWKEFKIGGAAFYNSLNKIEYTITNSKVDVLSNNVALIYGQYKLSAVDTAGNQINESSAWTWVCNRQNDQWKIVHVHGSSMEN